MNFLQALAHSSEQGRNTLIPRWLKGVRFSIDNFGSYWNTVCDSIRLDGELANFLAFAVRDGQTLNPYIYKASARKWSFFDRLEAYNPGLFQATSGQARAISDIQHFRNKMSDAGGNILLAFLGNWHPGLFSLKSTKGVFSKIPKDKRAAFVKDMQTCAVLLFEGEGLPYSLPPEAAPSISSPIFPVRRSPGSGIKMDLGKTPRGVTGALVAGDMRKPQAVGPHALCWGVFTRKPHNIMVVWPLEGRYELVPIPADQVAIMDGHRFIASGVSAVELPPEGEGVCAETDPANVTYNMRYHDGTIPPQGVLLKGKHFNDPPSAQTVARLKHMLERDVYTVWDVPGKPSDVPDDPAAWLTSFFGSSATPSALGLDALPDDLEKLVDRSRLNELLEYADFCASHPLSFWPAKIKPSTNRNFRNVAALFCHLGWYAPYTRGGTMSSEGPGLSAKVGPIPASRSAPRPWGTDCTQWVKSVPLFGGAKVALPTRMYLSAPHLKSGLTISLADKKRAWDRIVSNPDEIFVTICDSRLADQFDTQTKVGLFPTYNDNTSFHQALITAGGELAWGFGGGTVYKEGYHQASDAAGFRYHTGFIVGGDTAAVGIKGRSVLSSVLWCDTLSGWLQRFGVTLDTNAALAFASKNGVNSSLDNGTTAFSDASSEFTVVPYNGYDDLSKDERGILAASGVYSGNYNPVEHLTQGCKMIGASAFHYTLTSAYKHRLVGELAALRALLNEPKYDSVNGVLHTVKNRAPLWNKIVKLAATNMRPLDPNDPFVLSVRCARATLQTAFKRAWGTAMINKTGSLRERLNNSTLFFQADVAKNDVELFPSDRWDGGADTRLGLFSVADDGGGLPPLVNLAIGSSINPRPDRSGIVKIRVHSVNAILLWAMTVSGLGGTGDSNESSFSLVDENGRLGGDSVPRERDNFMRLFLQLQIEAISQLCSLLDAKIRGSVVIHPDIVGVLNPMSLLPENFRALSGVYGHYHSAHAIADTTRVGRKRGYVSLRQATGTRGRISHYTYSPTSNSFTITFY